MMHKFLGSVTAIVLVCAFSASTVNAKVLATVNDTKITDEMVNKEYNKLPDNYKDKSKENQIKKMLLENLIESNVIVSAANKKGVAETAEYKEELQTFAKMLLVRKYIDGVINSKVTDSLIKDTYQKQYVNAPKEIEVHGSHILLKTEKEANDVIAKLNKGEKFVALAKKYSTGPSASKGGDLGWFTKGQMVAEFSKVIFDLKDGSYAKKPVKSSFGWHVVWRQASREKAVPTLDSVKNKIRQGLVQKVGMEYIKELKSKAKIVYAKEASAEKK